MTHFKCLCVCVRVCLIALISVHNIIILTFFKSLFSATTATALEHLGTTITSDFDGTPPLYITKMRKNNQEYIYVNNALVLHSRSNIQMMNEAGKKQVIYSILYIVHTI